MDSAQPEALPRLWLLSFLVLQPVVGEQEEGVISCHCYQMTSFSAEQLFLSSVMAAKRPPGWGGGHSPSPAPL